MKRLSRLQVAVAIVVVLVIAALAVYVNRNRVLETAGAEPLRVGIAPYQDMAMLMAYKPLNLEAKHDVQLEVVTLAWEEVIPSLASSGRTVDVGFGSLIEFLTKYENINAGSTDPLVYVYPAYVFKGGGFVSFNPKVPDLDKSIPASPELLRQFFSFRIGAQKNSMFDMLLFSLSSQAGIGRDEVRITDTTMADGLLAAQAGSLDAAAAGLTQRNEALERGGRIVLTMDKFGFADLTGFIARQSTLNSRRNEIEKLVRVWFDSVDYVYSDLDNNSAVPIAYLSQKSSTQYTVDSYKRALEAEYLPRSVEDANRDLVADSGPFSIKRISSSVNKYLVEEGIAKNSPPVPVPIQVRP